MSTLGDTAITGLEPARAVEAAELLLGRLGLKASDADTLMTLPAERIISALAGSATSGQADISLRFVPVVDGHTLPAHPFEPAASEISATVPLMVGSNECEAIPYGNPDDPYWTKEPADIPELRAQVKRVVSANDAEADVLIALYRSHRPMESLADIAAVIAGDASALRSAAHVIAQRKFAQGKAQVFLRRSSRRLPDFLIRRSGHTEGYAQSGRVRPGKYIVPGRADASMRDGAAPFSTQSTIAANPSKLSVAGPPAQ